MKVKSHDFLNGRMNIFAALKTKIDVIYLISFCDPNGKRIQYTASQAYIHAITLMK